MTNAKPVARSVLYFYLHTICINFLGSPINEGPFQILIQAFGSFALNKLQLNILQKKAVGGLLFQFAVSQELDMFSSWGRVKGMSALYIFHSAAKMTPQMALRKAEA